MFVVDLSYFSRGRKLSTRLNWILMALPLNNEFDDGSQPFDQGGDEDFPNKSSPLLTLRLFVSCCSCETQRCSLSATCNPLSTPRQIPRLQLERAFLFYLFIHFAQKTSFYSFHFSSIFHFFTQFYLRHSVLLHFIIIILINSLPWNHLDFSFSL